MASPGHNELNTLLISRLQHNGQQFADAICTYIFFNENVWISIQISLSLFPWVKFIIQILVQIILAWHRTGDKSLSEPKMAQLIKTQWVKWKGVNLHGTVCVWFKVLKHYLCLKFHCNIEPNFHNFSEMSGNYCKMIWRDQSVKRDWKNYILKKCPHLQKTNE